jgi:hypothetical protein
MKKIIVLIIAIIVVLCPSTAYAQSTEYDVYVNHIKQPFVGIMDEQLLLPVKETYDLLGGKYTYDRENNVNVYQFKECVVEDYIDDHVVYMSGAYLGELETIGGIKFGASDLFDISSVTMMVDDENHRVNFLTRGYLEDLLLKETRELSKVAPDLVNSINDLLLTTVDMTFNVNATFTSLATDVPVSSSNSYKRTLVNVDGQAYGDIQNTIFDATFNVKLDQNRSVRRVMGFEARILDDMLYAMEPMTKKWMKERLRYQLEEMSAMSLTQENTFFIATLRDYLQKSQSENGNVTYGIKLNEEELKSLDPQSPYGNMMLAIQEEMKKENSTYDLQGLEVSFHLDGEKIDILHTELLIKEVTDSKETEMNIAVDIEFVNQGEKKEVVSPM